MPTERVVTTAYLQSVFRKQYTPKTTYVSLYLEMPEHEHTVTRQLIESTEWTLDSDSQNVWVENSIEIVFDELDYAAECGGVLILDQLGELLASFAFAEPKELISGSVLTIDPGDIKIGLKD